MPEMRIGIPKMERARLKEIPARSKSGEEGPCAFPHNAQGSHGRPTGNSTTASRSGGSRKIGAFRGPQAIHNCHVGSDAHALFPTLGRSTWSGHATPSGHSAANHATRRS